jgi:hypothetical protein
VAGDARPFRKARHHAQDRKSERIDTSHFERAICLAVCDFEDQDCTCSPCRNKRHCAAQSPRRGIGQRTAESIMLVPARQKRSTRQRSWEQNTGKRQAPWGMRTLIEHHERDAMVLKRLFPRVRGCPECALTLLAARVRGRHAPSTRCTRSGPHLGLNPS